MAKRMVEEKSAVKACVLGRDTVESLFEQALSDGGPALYKNGAVSIPKEAILPMEGDFDLSELILQGEKPEDDVENAKRLHTQLRALTPQMAADERLWAYLAHVPFRDYVMKRWAPEKSSEISDYFFVRGGSARALRRHGVARLWWAAQLTYQPWVTFPELKELDNGDPYRLVAVLLRKQDIYMQLVERRFGSDRKLLACLLHVIDRNWAIFDINSRELIRRLARGVNMRCKFSNPTALDTKDLVRELELIVGVK